MKIFKILILVLSFTFLGNSAQAENDSLVSRFDSNYKHSVGVYSSGLIRFLNSNTKYLYPYRFIYRYNMGLNTIRVGLKGDIDLVTDLDLDDSLTIQKSNSSYGFRVGAGYERYKVFNSRFSMFYGAELNFYKKRDKDFTKTDLASTTEFKHRNNLGISPLIGLEVTLSKHFSLSSELMFNTGASFRKTQTSVVSGNENKGMTTRSTGYFAYFNFPRAITLRANF